MSAKPDIGMCLSGYERARVRIAELEAENARLTRERDNWQKASSDLDPLVTQLEQAEAENARLAWMLRYAIQEYAYDGLGTDAEVTGFVTELAARYAAK